MNGATTAYVYDVGNLRDITGHDVLLEYSAGTLSRHRLNGQGTDEPVQLQDW